MSSPTAADAPQSRRGKIRAQLQALGQQPRKRFGQHFLADKGIAERIVNLARLTGREAVIEIGPGLGALTDLLAGKARELWLIEIDFGLAASLRDKYADQLHVHVIEGDAMDVDYARFLPEGEKATVVANLPYNIATPLIAEMLKRGQLFQRLVLMVQREVAQRLRAKPGSADYSGLSVCTQFAASVHKGLVVGPSAFVPRPRVESEVIVIEPHSQPVVEVSSEETFRKLVHTVFLQRRKQLRNSLRGMTPVPEPILHAAGIDPARRPETLSLQEFAAIANLLHAQASDTAEH